MNRFHFLETGLSGLWVAERTRLEDARGFLSRVFCAREFAQTGLRDPIVQINHTCTRGPGTVRGMHLQFPPHAETKVVSCLRGEVFDVAVDLRKGSPSLLRYHAEILSADNRRALVIPPGFAHGFQVLGGDCELLYLHTAPYVPAAEGGVGPADPRVGIDWPLEVRGLSERDRSHPPLSADFEGIPL